MDYWLTRLCIQKALAFVYCIAFLIVINQFKPLLGRRGLMPAQRFLQGRSFWQVPSLFWLHCSDLFLTVMGWLGLFLSVLALLGIGDHFVLWFLLWALYLSFVNIGQTFYGFGWEILLLETGFLAIFLGPADQAPSIIVIWLFRWLLFRVMLGAGLIKIRGDRCWRDLTALFTYYETQPLPGPLSRAFHRLPLAAHKATAFFTHFVELVVPFTLFWPPELALFGGLVSLFFQVMLIVSGNLSWLNYITIVLCLSCFNDSFLSHFISLSPPLLHEMSVAHQAVILLLFFAIVYLSIKPTQNLLSSRQIMNTSFNPLHLVNTYGAFGSITRKRNEIILEGSLDGSTWLAYEFRGKPGNVNRRPPQVSPYHFKLDWQMWFAAMSNYLYHPWTVTLCEKMLQGDRAVLSLLKTNPFPDAPPKFVRAQLYEYHFSDGVDGTWWRRELKSSYLPPLSLDTISSFLGP